MARSGTPSSMLLISAGAYPRRRSEMVASGSAVQGPPPRRGGLFFCGLPLVDRRNVATSLAGTPCCKRASEIRSQLRPGWQCAYTQLNQDSATIDEQLCYRL